MAKSLTYVSIILVCCLACGPEDPEAHLRQLAASIENKRAELPKQMEDHLTWEAIDYENNRVTYHYTWRDPALAKLDAEALRADLTPKLRDFLCKDPDANLFRKAGVDVAYSYHNEAGAHLITIETFARDCDPEKPGVITANQTNAD